MNFNLQVSLIYFFQFSNKEIERGFKVVKYKMTYHRLAYLEVDMEGKRAAIIFEQNMIPTIWQIFINKEIIFCSVNYKTPKIKKDQVRKILYNVLMVNNFAQLLV